MLCLVRPHLSFFWWLGRAVLCGCGIFWISSFLVLFTLLLSVMGRLCSVSGTLPGHLLIDTICTIDKICENCFINYQIMNCP